MDLQDHQDICDWALALDPDCESVCLIVTSPYVAQEGDMLAALEPYLTDETRLYRTSGPMVTNEGFSLYAIPIDADAGA